MIGDTLRLTRHIYGYKASELSVLLGISRSYLSEIENNKKQPSLDLLGKYAEIYGIKLSLLIALYENFEESKRVHKSDEFIRNMVLNLIHSTYESSSK